MAHTSVGITKPQQCAQKEILSHWTRHLFIYHNNQIIASARTHNWRQTLELPTCTMAAPRRCAPSAIVPTPISMSTPCHATNAQCHAVPTHPPTYATVCPPTHDVEQQAATRSAPPHLLHHTARPYALSWWHSYKPCGYTAVSRNRGAHLARQCQMWKVQNQANMHKILHPMPREHALVPRENMNANPRPN